MVKHRASIFSTATELDVTGFAPKPETAPAAPAMEEVRAVSQGANFRSRESAAPRPETKPKRAPRLHRTGRNVQFNVKAKQETVDTIYAITEAHPGWVLGYTLERAIEALQRELKKQP